MNDTWLFERKDEDVDTTVSSRKQGSRNVCAVYRTKECDTTVWSVLSV